jgi:hypothetical protein
MVLRILKALCYGLLGELYSIYGKLNDENEKWKYDAKSFRYYCKAIKALKERSDYKA